LIVHMGSEGKQARHFDLNWKTFHMPRSVSTGFGRRYQTEYSYVLPVAISRFRAWRQPALPNRVLIVSLREYDPECA
jgi:hypothetical protein